MKKLAAEKKREWIESGQSKVTFKRIARRKRVRDRAAKFAQDKPS